MNRASLICNCQNEIKKVINMHKKIRNDLGESLSPEEETKIREQIISKHTEKWSEMIDLNNILTDLILNKKGISKTQWYFITVRPDPKITLDTFVKKVDKYINRLQILTYKMSLEQKCVEGSGTGFHMHAVVDATWESFEECRRATFSTFKNIAGGGAIKIKTTNNPGEMFNNYCIEYKSKKQHKISTKNGDAIWRANHNIKEYYDSKENRFSALSIKVRTVQNSINPFIVEIA